MQVSQLSQNPSPFYLLSSSEPLLVRDWLDEARSALRETGFDDIQNLVTDAGFDWAELLEDSDMLSLFASRKCRIVSIVNGKPGQKGAKAIQSLCENIPEDTVYIFVVPGFDRQSKNAAWFKSLQAAGEVVELKPVYANELVGWIKQRASGKGLSIDQQSAAFLAERTEGNLLAADQELEKLSIRFSGEPVISFDAIEKSVSQSARYNHFILVDACLAGKPARALKILDSLPSEGYVTTQIRWSLQSVLEQLNGLMLAQSNGNLSDRVWQALRIWRNKQRLYQGALARMTGSQIERLLQSCATLDRLGKGQQDADYPDQDWLQLRSLIGQFCGLRLQL
ncbi:MAG: DNA polymerase III subunit delta [Gammaproteobacteria bacterium]|nr:DNA polymerase III subunit delta [Gammaproteobacteria bacterium]